MANIYKNIQNYQWQIFSNKLLDSDLKQTKFFDTLMHCAFKKNKNLGLY